ncbi:MAG: DUF4118 domain-containing protein [Elusimicrobia bacterium]|nr:DUF4118 domain-containing protein [Elusimicrobiota bacterium]
MKTRARDYLFAALAVALSTGVSFLAFPFLHPTNLVMFYILGTLAVAARGHRGPAAASCALGVLAFDFFFVPPRFTFTVSDAQYIITFLAFFISAMVISDLTIRLRREAIVAREAQKRTEMMHSLAQRLSIARGSEEVAGIAAISLAETFNGEVLIYFPATDGRLQSRSSSAALKPEEKELGAAQWAYVRGQSAGVGTGALPLEKYIMVPLIGAGGPVGVVSLHPREGAGPLAREERLLLEACARQVALSLEVEALQEAARRARTAMENERLRSALLSSVSHDLRTPLTAIVGSAGALLERDEIRNNTGAAELVENIQDEGQRLSRLVQNLLQTTRLESGTVRIKKEIYPLEEVVGSALERVSPILKGRPVRVDLPEDLPQIGFDPILLEQVFVNLIENAVRHTDPSQSIDLVARRDGSEIQVVVADHGPGINPEDLEKVFEKFYREPNSPGAGLGLAICRAVIKLHGGRIWAENGSGGGAVFRFTLPLEVAHAA